jgi:hypothetical protein
MYLRQKFVTNSSSTSIVAFGVAVRRSSAPDDIYDIVDEYYSKGLNCRTNPSETLFIYVTSPQISVNKDGLPEITNAIEFQERYLTLKKLLEDNGLPTNIRYIQESWWDG